MSSKRKLSAEPTLQTHTCPYFMLVDYNAGGKARQIIARHIKLDRQALLAMILGGPAGLLPVSVYTMARATS